MRDILEIQEEIDIVSVRLKDAFGSEYVDEAIAEAQAKAVPKKEWSKHKDRMEAVLQMELILKEVELRALRRLLVVYY